MYRILPTLLLLSSCGVFGLSAEEAELLASYQRNAKTYWGGGDFDRALSQVRRGLELSPDDYQLHVIKASCLLRMSNNNARTLDSAIDAFDHVLTLRADQDQGPQARLGYAQAYTKRGIRAMREHNTIQQDAERLGLKGAELELQNSRAEKLALDAAADLRRAKSQLELMVNAGDYVLEAYFTLMQVSAWQGDYAQAIQFGDAYLTRVGELQDSIRKNLESTVIVEYEREIRIRLQNRLDEELEVRGFLANLHYKQGHHELVVEQLTAILKKNPRLHREYFNRARSLLQLGRLAEAKSDYERFLYSTNLPRENPQVKAALAALKEIE